MRAGDHVSHIPSKEEWILSAVDNGQCIPAGWPESMALLSDCAMIEECTDEKHQEMLTNAINCGGMRGSMASRERDQK